jgi:hypothetical protein
MFLRATVTAGVAMLVVALGATDSYAQFSGGRGGMGGMSGGGRSGNRDQSNQENRNNNRPVQEDTYEQMEYRLSLLEEDLHLRPEQRAAWEAFAGRVRAYASDLARARPRAMTPAAATGGSTGVSGVQVIEQAADAARNRATALDDAAGAAKALYAGFNADQKMLADVRIATIVAPQPRNAPSQAGGSNLPDLGSSGSSSGRPPR